MSFFNIISSRVNTLISLVDASHIYQTLYKIQQIICQATQLLVQPRRVKETFDKYTDFSYDL